MVLYILAIAVLNLMLGFATAMYLARRYDASYPVDALSRLPSCPVPQAKGSDESEKEAAHGSETSAIGSEGELAEPSDDSPTEEEMLEPVKREKTLGEMSVSDFRDQVQQYHQMLIGFDDRLRGLIQSANKDEVGACLTSLRRANEDYLGSRERVCGVFEQLHRERREFEAVGNRVQAAVVRQTEQIENTNKFLGGFNLEGDLQEGCRQLVGETSRLLEVNDHLRDTLDEAYVAVAREEKWLESVEEAERKDPLTGLANRTGLESALAQWWGQAPERQQPLTAAMIDVDGFTQVNQQHGRQVGNRVLRALAELFTSECQEYTVAARYAGQRFVLLFGGVDVRFTTNLVERIRQSVELAHLRCGDEDIRLTISCAVTEALANDSPTTLYTRSEQALQEAKRYGRNRTFLHDGKYPTPVVPPTFSIEEKEIDI